ncbi:hypothetical protein LRS03_09630 [Rhizobacter sp. J219]|jgi:hypothetical protein|uniref:hypothetical protein n=1 Tax=Rhizobacter sp. J219 TaxID=2898430 RepID=UPI0021509D04|nr:hypothetical protein [Rhizobacter sp. J219]MCR5883097.1 hypothetical protein [Rhizobacter sp. J219]
MPNLSPVKTALGQDELRHRTRGLGQRYRTVLFLVDGRRSLGDVLAMALKAGAQTNHFQELVEMGLVEVPTEMAAAEPVETEPGALDTPRLTSVDLDVFPEPALTPMAELLPDDEDSRPAPLSPVLPPAAPPQALLEPQLPRRVFEDPKTVEQREVVMGSAQGLPMIDVGDIGGAPPAPAPAPAAVAASPYAQAPAVVLNEAPRTPEWVQSVRETPFKTADHARPAPRMTDEERLQYVRDLLLDTLRRDSLLFATFSVGRVRAATTHKELIKLVWEIERDRAHPRRNRDQLLNLQRARELLGMGNTLVAGDSQPGAPPSEY